MKRLTILLTIILLSTKAIFAQSGADKIIGTWLNQEKDGKIEIYKNGDKYFGKIVWGKELFEPDGKTSRTDIKNSDPSLRSRKLYNLVILTNFKYDDGEWNGGKIYDPKSGKTYSCIMKFDGDKLQIKGYIGVSLLGRTTVWTRA
jgi:uncharacterized protein (DUF2147 family)